MLNWNQHLCVLYKTLWEKREIKAGSSLVKSCIYHNFLKETFLSLDSLTVEFIWSSLTKVNTANRPNMENHGRLISPGNSDQFSEANQENKHLSCNYNSRVNLFSKSDLIKIHPCSGTPQRTQDELVIPANKRSRSQDVGIKGIVQIFCGVM